MIASATGQGLKKRLLVLAMCVVAFMAAFLLAPQASYAEPAGSIGPNSPKSYLVGEEATFHVNAENIKGELKATFPSELSGLTYDAKSKMVKGTMPATVSGDSQEFTIEFSGVGLDDQPVTGSVMVTVFKDIKIDQLTDRYFKPGAEVIIPVAVSPSSVDAVKVSDSTPLPKGLKFVFNEHGRQIKGTVNETLSGPSDKLTFPVTIEAKDGSVTKTMSFKIFVTNEKPPVTPKPTPTPEPKDKGFIGPQSPRSFLAGEEAIINLNYGDLNGDLTVTFPAELKGLTYKNGQIKGTMPKEVKGKDKDVYKVELSGKSQLGKELKDTLYIEVYKNIAIDQLTDRTFDNGAEVKIPFYVYPASVDTVAIKDTTPLPNGLKYVFDSHGRQITGKLDVKFDSSEAEKVFPVTVVASDPGKGSAEMTFKITVKNPNYVASGDSGSGTFVPSSDVPSTSHIGRVLPKTGDENTTAFAAFALCAGVIMLGGSVAFGRRTC